MSLRVIGAGLGRTGTTSLRDALSQLLEGRCYHFEDVIAIPEHAHIWMEAVEGKIPNWDRIYSGYVATTDWPGAAFWSELYEANPGSIVLLSRRANSTEWFDSVKDTIEPLMTRSSDEPEAPWHLMAQELLRVRFVPVPFDRSDAEAAYERHNATVRASVSPEHLLEWMPGDGWEPLCEFLGVEVPAAPFPHTNTKKEYRESLARAGTVDPEVRAPGGTVMRIRSAITNRVRRS
ncbi:MAG: sulfotransferase family protein [Acidimicrobiales bacterium]